jgi:hypothetical protein
MTAGLLPEGFGSLEPLVDSWGVRTSNGRSRRRIASTEAERQAFYDAMAPELERALDHLDRYDVDQLPPPEQRLLDLVLMTAHISLAVEKQGPDEATHAIAQATFTITRSTADELSAPIRPEEDRWK